LGFRRELAKKILGQDYGGEKTAGTGHSINGIAETRAREKEATDCTDQTID